MFIELAEGALSRSAIARMQGRCTGRLSLHFYLFWRVIRPTSGARRMNLFSYRLDIVYNIDVGTLFFFCDANLFAVTSFGECFIQVFVFRIHHLRYRGVQIMLNSE